MPLRSRKVTPAWSAEASCVRLKARIDASPIASPPASPPPAPPPVPREPTEAATPTTVARIEMIVAFSSPSPRRARCPPAMWPVSCAMTPDQLLRRIGHQDQPREDEHVHAAGHEGIHVRAVDQDDAHIVGPEVCRDEDRAYEVMQRRFDLEHRE